VPGAADNSCGVPAGFVDIHCHVLPGLDDGPRILEVSEQMCALARASGTAAIVATPHANHRFAFDPVKTAEQLARLGEKVNGSLRLFTGCEVEMSMETMPAALRNPAAYSLAGSRYLLLELMPTGIPPNLEGVFSRLLDRGFVPVLAHPERNVQLQKRPDKVGAWVERGCLTQLTADSLTGRMGRRAQAAAVELIQHRIVHFVASDAHDPVHRPPRLVDGYRIVGEMFGSALANLLFIENPRAVVQNQVIAGYPAF